MSKTVEVPIVPETTRTEADISFEVGQLQARLRELFLERRGMQVTGAEEAWCCMCGKTKVRAAEGEDVCDRCTSSLPPGA